MVSEFHLLSEKINRLSELVQNLRRENTDLRLEMAALTDENAGLARRIQEAHQRVSALLAKIPVPDHDEETT